MTKQPKETTIPKQSAQNNKTKPKYEPPKLSKFEKLQKLIVSGE